MKNLIEQNDRANEILRAILCDSSDECEYDKEIYEYLKEIGGLPEGYAPYWIVDELEDVETDHLCPMDANQENFENLGTRVTDFFDGAGTEKAPLPAGYESFGAVVERLKGENGL